MTTNCNFFVPINVQLTQYLKRGLEIMRQLKITKQVTNRETASLDKYLQEIGKVDLITDRKSKRLNYSHVSESRMPCSA